MKDYEDWFPCIFIAREKSSERRSTEGSRSVEGSSNSRDSSTPSGTGIEAEVATTDVIPMSCGAARVVESRTGPIIPPFSRDCELSLYRQFHFST